MKTVYIPLNMVLELLNASGIDQVVKDHLKNLSETYGIEVERHKLEISIGLPEYELFLKSKGVNLLEERIEYIKKQALGDLSSYATLTSTRFSRTIQAKTYQYELFVGKVKVPDEVFLKMIREEERFL